MLFLETVLSSQIAAAPPPDSRSAPRARSHAGKVIAGHEHAGRLQERFRTWTIRRMAGRQLRSPPDMDDPGHRRSHQLDAEDFAVFGQQQLKKLGIGQRHRGRVQHPAVI
jgi:hypothetical protein